MYKKISDYGIIGNLHTTALVGIDGSIDWLCLPHLDSPSIFAAILDENRGGSFSVSPAGEWDSTAAYLPGTNILTTTFRSRTGEMRLTDFMPVSNAMECMVGKERHELYRLVELTDGHLDVRAIFSPQFDYARCETILYEEAGAIVARGGDDGVVLCSSREGLHVKGDRVEADWRMAAGEELWLHLNYGLHGPRRLDPVKVRRILGETGEYWRSWLARNETGIELDFGPFRAMIERSALVLKLLQFKPSGVIAAAPTTSLPEVIGGERNWDYRFSWIRDSSLTLEALFNLGHIGEMEDYLRWIEGIIIAKGRRLQVLYGLHGETELTEEVLSHLEGYKGSRPVRIGNSAARQNQQDIFGEIMDAAMRLVGYFGKVSDELRPLVVEICEWVTEHWRDQDSGIWEVRGGPRHFVHSKVMCWVALDRGITIARRYGVTAELSEWEGARNAIREEVLAKGWNREKRSFVQHYGTDSIDASALLIPIFGFLPFDDPKVLDTVAAIRRELSVDGFIYRYRDGDSLPGDEGVFLVCTFWLVDNLIAQGELYEAELILLRAEQSANRLGLFSEEYDPVWKEELGNFPQALTHIGYVNSVMALVRAKAKSLPDERVANPISGCS